MREGLKREEMKDKYYKISFYKSGILQDVTVKAENILDAIFKFYEDQCFCEIVTIEFMPL